MARRTKIAGYTLACCVFSILAGTGCDTQGQQEAFIDDAFSTPSGFSHTDEDGRVLSHDADDWRTSPVYVGRVFVDPAYPNPTEGGFVSIPVSVREFNAVRGGLRVIGTDANGRSALLDEAPEARDPGAYVFTFNPLLLGRTGLVRVYILDGFGEMVSYGDLQIE